MTGSGATGKRSRNEPPAPLVQTPVIEVRAFSFAGRVKVVRPRKSRNRVTSGCHRICFPETSAHLLASTPTSHYLEYVDWANVLLEEPLQIAGGQAILPSRPGNGMVWDHKAVERLRMR